MKLRKLSALLILCLTTSAHATILMIDLNLNLNEVRAAREAAHFRGENLVVVPNLSDEKRVHLHHLGSKIEDIGSEISSYEVNGKSVPSALRVELQTLTEEMDTEREQHPLGIPEIYGAISQIENSDELVDAFIISGHSNGSLYTGSMAGNHRFTLSDLEYIFNNHPRSKTALKSIYLWGCYTQALYHSIWWKQHFPRTPFVLGNSEIGYEGDSLPSPAMLKNALINEDHILSATDLESAKQFLLEIPYAKVSSLAGINHQFYVGVTAESEDLSDKVSCTGALDQLRPGLEIFRSYQTADSPEFAIPPANSHAGPLRQFYSDLQNHFYCLPKSTAEPYPVPEQVLPLIFFRSVAKNFGQFYAAQIQEINDYLEKTHANATLRLPNLLRSGLSRKEILEKYDAVGTYFTLADLPEKDALHVQDTMNFLSTAEEQMLVELKCVPITWSTEDPTPGVKPAAPFCYY